MHPGVYVTLEDVDTCLFAKSDIPKLKLLIQFFKYLSQHLSTEKEIWSFQECGL